MMLTTKTRLAYYREQAAKAKYPNAQNWRYWERNIWQTPNNSRSHDGKKIYTDHVTQFGKYLGDSHTLTRIDHTGWYADNFQNDLIVGGVAKLRCPKGVLYIPVTHCTGWDSTIHHIGCALLVPKGATEEVHDQAIRDSAYRADRCAELEAEEAREEDAKYQAELDIDDAREAIHQINASAIALLKEIKAAGKRYTPAVCMALTTQIKEYLSERREQFQIIADREENFWSAVERY